MPEVIETAVPLDDLEQPLLHGSDDVEIPNEDEILFEEEVVQDVFYYFLLLGWTLGFILQCISLGATAAMALLWEHIPTTFDGSASSEQLFYWTLYGLSNSWLLLFPIVCLAIERSWNKSGICFLQSHLLDIERPVLTRQTKRMAFVASVRFLVGVVLGCFMTWGLIDMYLGASPSMLVALMSSMMACLVLCYGMVVIYDSFTS